MIDNSKIDESPRGERMKKQVLLFALILLPIMIPHPAHSQTCFNAKPLPDCKRFFLTEFTYGNQANDTLNRGHLFSPEFGMMFNLGKKHAVGGTCFIDVLAASDFGDRYRLGLKGRYRFWLNSSFCGGVGRSLGWLHRSRVTRSFY
jgi:hypothetical protein